MIDMMIDMMDDDSNNDRSIIIESLVASEVYQTKENI